MAEKRLLCADPSNQPLAHTARRSLSRRKAASKLPKGTALKDGQDRDDEFLDSKGRPLRPEQVRCETLTGLGSG